MKDFVNYFDFIKDEETRSSVRRIADKISYVSKNYLPAVTEFTNPYAAELSIPIIKNSDIKLRGKFSFYTLIIMMALTRLNL